MSRTIRKILSLSKNKQDSLFIEEVDDTAAKHRKVRYGMPKKLKPYTKQRDPYKERAADRTWDNKRKSKVQRDRINRSFKKGFRQQLKKELEQELEIDL